MFPLVLLAVDLIQRACQDTPAFFLGKVDDGKASVGPNGGILSFTVCHEVVIAMYLLPLSQQTNQSSHMDHLGPWLTNAVANLIDDAF